MMTVSWIGLMKNYLEQIQLKSLICNILPSINLNQVSSLHWMVSIMSLTKFPMLVCAALIHLQLCIMEETQISLISIHNLIGIPHIPALNIWIHLNLSVMLHLIRI